MVVDEDGPALGVLADALRHRHGTDYPAIAQPSAATALHELAYRRNCGGDVAVLIARMGMADMSGAAVLTRAHDLFPAAQRVLLIDLLDNSANGPLSQAMAWTHRLLAA